MVRKNNFYKGPNKYFYDKEEAGLAYDQYVRDNSPVPDKEYYNYGREIRKKEENSLSDWESI